MVIVPSGSRVIHGLSDCGVRVGAQPSSAIANERPAAPIITWRRDSAPSKSLACRVMSRLPRCALDGPNNSRVGAAAADVRAHMLDDFTSRRIRFLLKQVNR